MITKALMLTETEAEQRSSEIRSDLRKFERHDWSLWIAAGMIILSLTAAVAALSISSAGQSNDAFNRFHTNQSVRGLVGLVLLFSVYIVYQQVLLRRTRIRLAEQIAVATQQQVRAERFLQLAMIDPLTGLHNRRYFEERLAAEILRAQRHKRTLTILMLDLDNFKRFNDRHGHLAGDLALKIFAERVGRAVRGSDLAARIGGDEFLAVLPECKTGQVQTILDRIPPLDIEVGSEKVSFTFSAGWADYQENENARHLMERADQALYDKKRRRESPMASTCVN